MWATEVWPYINGKALMSQVRLEELEASDMLDVIHFMMEEDITYLSEGEADSRSSTRVNIYDSLYGRPYKFRKKPNLARPKAPEFGEYDDMGIQSELAGVDPFSPRNESKSKIAFVDAESMPVIVQSFEGLDAPLG